MPPASQEDAAELRRVLPSVDQVLRQPEVQALQARYGRPLLLRELRGLLETLRRQAATGDRQGLEDLLARLGAELGSRLAAASAPSLLTLINATGVVVHTNLGRAPLPAAAAERVARVASSYSNLEFDLASGERGDREVHTETRLRDLCGAPAALVVNNNAAALLLALNALAEGREVLVSRGELVEIGGSFRIPEILAKSGARLREVGTTNRTRTSDFKAALSPQTALILKVHTSNFRIVGFTESPGLGELVELASGAGIPLLEDLGAGLLAATDGPLAGEPVIADSLRAGVNVVTFSGDKLLGGPQAGLVVGDKALLDSLRRNPLYRALRIDKMTVAALDAVLAEHQAGRASEAIPVLRMLSLSREDVRHRAEAFAGLLKAAAPRLSIALAEGQSAVGGGAAPTVPVPTVLVSLTHPSLGPDRLAAELRAGQPPIVARVADDRLLLDLRTVRPEEEPALVEALRRVAEVTA
jgi:L-seryl-tRNA(Ser) seleniumtransferase